MTPNELAALHAAAFPHEPWSAADFAAFLQDPTTLLVTHSHGFALLRIVLDEAEILTFAVDPAAQGQGHGGVILANALRQANAGGAARVFLEVAADNAPARALYARAGFVQTGLRKGYYAQSAAAPVDALLLEHALS
ncbi:ribosomal protein S18-alanine N-acetyltransferase [Roseinatronobacter sp.]|uniref:ribosomal protein S18-alanine N-acetyltransferase n=1 Tax=Roseinatronobacter sp. TaxID=1945755 RepID=UPI0025CDDE03|nr:ribosomal protein S18-alanine N-acetyltransferase [Roseibaca sp.]